jgi:hypothetical protein
VVNENNWFHSFQYSGIFHSLKCLGKSLFKRLFARRLLATTGTFCSLSNNLHNGSNRVFQNLPAYSRHYSRHITHSLVVNARGSCESSHEPCMAASTVGHHPATSGTPILMFTGHQYYECGPHVPPDLRPAAGSRGAASRPRVPAAPWPSGHPPGPSSQVTREGGGHIWWSFSLSRKVL